MRTPANIAKHPIHPMLVAIPIGLWLFSLACDLIHLLGATSPNWLIVSRYTIVGGIIGALIAAVPGFIDMLALPWGLKRIALMHMSINLTVVALYVVNAWLRSRGAPGDGARVGGNLRKQSGSQKENEKSHAKILVVFADTIRKIPRGKVATYGQVASAAGFPGAARQVARSLA